MNPKIKLEDLPLADIIAYLEALPPQLPYSSLVGVPPGTNIPQNGVEVVTWSGTSPQSNTNVVSVAGTPTTVVVTLNGTGGTITGFPIGEAFLITAGSFQLRAITSDGSTPAAGATAAYSWIAI